MINSNAVLCRGCGVILEYTTDSEPEWNQTDAKCPMCYTKLLLINTKRKQEQEMK